MSHNNIGIPPDGAGKKIATRALTIVEFVNETTPIKVGDTVVGETSTTTGLVTGIERESKQEIYIEQVTGVYAAGENLKVGATIVAQVGTTDSVEVHMQGISLTDPDHPEHRLHVNHKGAAAVTFTEGETQFDSFGKTQVSQQHTLGNYTQLFDPEDREFWIDTFGAGAATYAPDESASILSVGTTSGDKCHKTSHKYHIYQPGVSQTVLMTASMGDTGKAGVRRRWGYFDVNDGVFFELDGTSFNVVLRSSTSGSVVETVIPQTSFNVDTVDGNGNSELNLNLMSVNIFWIDLQWLGAGRVRFGIFNPDGTRLTLHSLNNANSNPRAYMRSGTLPIRFEIENTAISASSSEMKHICATVKTEGDFKPKAIVFGAHSDVPIAVDETAYVPLLSIQANLLHGGKHNAVAAIPSNVSVIAGDAGPVRCDITISPVLTGATWNVANLGSAFTVDRDATALTGGAKIFSFLVGAGQVEEIDLTEILGYNSIYGRLNADGVTQNHLTLKAKGINATTTTSAFASITWKELS